MKQRDAKGPRPAEWARRCLEPEHYTLTAFFVEPEGGGIGDDEPVQNHGA